MAYPQDINHIFLLKWKSLSVWCVDCRRKWGATQLEGYLKYDKSLTVNRRPLLLVVYWDTVYTYFNIFYLIERKIYYIIYLNVTRLCVT